MKVREEEETRKAEIFEVFYGFQILCQGVTWKNASMFLHDTFQA